MLYVGTKTNSGSAIDRAGLTNGSLCGIVVTGASTDAAFRTAYSVGTAAPFTTIALTGATGAALQTDATAKNVFGPDRTEDGVWDPSNPNDFYFVTTGSTAAASGRGGLWKRHFNNVSDPLAGRTLTLPVDHPATHAATDNSSNQPGFYMPDNVTMDAHGHIVLLEDPGADNYVARVFAYDVASNQLKPTATFDPARFAPGPRLITTDEETSGVIDTEGVLGAGTFLLDAQVHTSTGLSLGGAGSIGAITATARSGPAEANRDVGPPARPPRAASPGRQMARLALLCLAAIGTALLLEAFVVSGLQHRAAQTRLFARFRGELARGEAPVGQSDPSGRLLALGTPVALLEIPDAHIREVVGEGTTPDVLTAGPGHSRATPLPGQSGTSAILGRRAAFGGPFKRVRSLRPGALIRVTTEQGQSEFHVIGVSRRPATQVYVRPAAGRREIARQSSQHLLSYCRADASQDGHNLVRFAHQSSD